MNKLIRWCPLLVLIIFMGCCPCSFSQSGQDAPTTARNFVIALSKSWDVKEIKLWADPSFNGLIDKDPISMQKTFKDVGQKLGNLKSIRSVNPAGPIEPVRAMYVVDLDYEKGPAKMNLELNLVGKLWKVRQIGMDSKLLTVADLNKATLTGLKQYVDYVIPKLGRKWDFAEFKAEADPRMFQSNQVMVQTIFSNMTGMVGPLVSYKNSQLVGSGVKNGAPMASYKAFFTGKNGEGMAAITVSYEGKRYKITDLNISKKIGRLPGYPQH